MNGGGGVGKGVRLFILSALSLLWPMKEHQIMKRRILHPVSLTIEPTDSLTMYWSIHLI